MFRTILRGLQKMNRSEVRRVGGAALLFFLALALSGSARAQDAPTLFKTKCAACHGADGSGNTTIGKSLGAKDLGSAEVQKQTDAQLTDIITNGMAGGKMPAYKGKLTDDDIKGLVGYIRTLAKK
jgi:mono/diheme cytochrome c family protein